MKIVALSGSLRKDSFNTALVREIIKLAPAGMEIEQAEIGDVPLYNSDLEAQFPPAAQALKDKIAAADGLIIVTPEYNRSIPGVLKNAIDWASRPYGKSSFTHKPVLIAGVSVGKIGTAIAQTHLRQVLSHLDANVIGQPELFLGPSGDILDAEGKIKDEGTKTLLLKALDVLRARVEG